MNTGFTIHPSVCWSEFWQIYLNEFICEFGMGENSFSLSLIIIIDIYIDIYAFYFVLLLLIE